MKIAYCTNVRLPSERAHGHQVAQVCDALVHLGHEVEVFAPYRDNTVSDDYWTYYKAEKAVKVYHLGSYDWIGSPLPGVLKLWTMNIFLRRTLRRVLPAGNFDVLYTRSPALLPALLDTGVPTILELHQLPNRLKGQFVSQCNRCSVVACLTSAMKQSLIEWGVKPEKLIVEGDAVDLRRFEELPTREYARNEFNLTTDRLIVGYIGRLKTLGMDKGVADILKAIAHMKHKRFFAFIVGGPQSDKEEYEKMAASLGLTNEDVLFLGEVPAHRVPMTLAACDILAMPFPDRPHYRHHMSPLKMFEYMAAERPLLTSELPTVRDVLSEETAIFCAPDNPESLASALEWIADHPAQAAGRAARAKELVMTKYSWEERMKRVLKTL